VIRSKHTDLFEIYRYKEMFELFLNISINSFQWRDLYSEPNRLTGVCRKPYVVFFPGSSAYLKRWAASNFVDVANYLLTNHSYQIVLAGSEKDKKYAKAILAGVEKKYRSRLLDLTGKTSLIELASVIGSCDFLVTNDSASIHMAAVTNKDAICMFMGESYGHFVPYPREIYAKGRFICPPEIERLVKNKTTDPGFLLLDYNPDINAINSKSVIAMIEELLSTRNKKYFYDSSVVAENQ